MTAPSGTAGAAPGTADRYPTRLPGGSPPIARTEPVVWGGGPGPLDAERLAAYDRDGFVTIDRLLGPDEAAAQLAGVERLRADPALRGDDRAVVEPDSAEVRSVFEVHRISDALAALVADRRLVGIARQILGTDVYVHQSRINLKPGFGGNGFYWHSDFETWHAEDGMPAMRSVSISVALTANHVHNGGLMILPGSHRTFVPCAGETPPDHYLASLRNQEIGVPDRGSLTALAERHGIELITGAPGSATVFDSNCMHGSNGNITPYPRSNLFVVYNSVENALVEPYAAPGRRPEFIAARDFTPVG